MAGLLDFFTGGDQPSVYAGLLSPQQQAALGADRNQAIAAQLLAASGPSRLPVPLGAALGQAVMAGNQAQQSGEERAAKMAMLAPTIEEHKLKLKKMKDDEAADEAWKSVLTGKPSVGSSIVPKAAITPSPGTSGTVMTLAPGDALPYGGPGDGPVPPAVAAGLQKYGPGMQQSSGQEGDAPGGLPPRAAPQAPPPVAAPRSPVAVTPIAAPVPGAPGPAVGPGMAPGPGWQAPNAAQSQTVDEFARSLPAGLRQTLSTMSGKDSRAYVMGLYQKQMEQDKYAPMLGQNGELIGYQSRSTGKPEYLPAHLSDRWVEEPRNIGGTVVPGRKNVTTGKWEALDPTTTKINNTLVNQAPQAGAVQSAKDLAEIGKTYYEEAKTALKTIGNLKLQKGLLESGTDTGFGTETAMKISNALKTIGMDVDPKLPSKEFLQSLATQMQINAQPKGQGAVSNFERDLFGQAVTNMGRSTEGNKKLVDWFLRIKRQDADVAQMYEKELASPEGRITPRFLTNVREHYEKPVFSDAEMNQMKTMAQGAPAAAVPAVPRAAPLAIPQRGAPVNPAAGMSNDALKQSLGLQ